MKQINISRTGYTYLDKEAVMDAYKSKEKQPLLESLFVHYFQFVANQEDYWDYNYIIPHLDDFIDYLNVLYPKYNYAYLFNNSSGRVKNCSDALHIIHMSIYHGDVQYKQRYTLIETTDGICGPYHDTEKLDMLKWKVYNTLYSHLRTMPLHQMLPFE